MALVLTLALHQFRENVHWLPLKMQRESSSWWLHLQIPVIKFFMVPALGAEPWMHFGLGSAFLVKIHVALIPVFARTTQRN